MTRCEDSGWIEVWNLSDSIVIRADLQPILNIVGRVHRPAKVESLSYALNGGKDVPIFFKRTAADSGRLERLGDFNVDTIASSELEKSNEIVFSARFVNGDICRQNIRFFVGDRVGSTNQWRLDLNGVNAVQEIGQIVDGQWRIGGDDKCGRYLEIREKESGLDRVLLLGPSDVGSDYCIKARLCVTSWTAPLHNVGLLYKWNHHLNGDGYSLPTQWTTGLAYYYSRCDGIRLRVGKNVHIADGGRKVGDYILCETHLSWWKCQLNRLLAKMRLKRYVLPQIVPGRQYYFELSVAPQRNSLTVWQVGHRKPKPQLVSEGTDDLLASGSIGIIAHKCGVRVYDFDYVSIPANVSNQ